MAPIALLLAIVLLISPLGFAESDESGANAQMNERQIYNSAPPRGLLAILASIFGFGQGWGGSSSSSGCVGSSEIACPRVNSYGRESFSTDAFSSVRSTAPSDLTSPYRIVGSFRKYYDRCISKARLGTCRFVNLGIKGDASHKKRRSCHNVSQAIDVGPLICSNGRRILASDPQFFEVAKCMANDSNDELEVIFYKTEGLNMKKRSDHNNHMHIQLKNCSMSYG